jgi:leader peptidase (prepilin peptidase)/N-methyltransferase
MSAGTLTAAQALLSYAASIGAGFGAGTAVNLLAGRVQDEETSVRGNQCHTCGAPLPAARLVPLAGFRRANRTCTTCGKTASLRAPILSLALALVYPLLLNHILSSASASHLPILVIFAIEAVACALLAFIFAVDLEHKLILDIAVYPALMALILIAALFDHKALAAMLFGLIIYGGLFLLLYGLGFLLYRTEALGLGDVKLALLIGLMIGWPAIVQALILGGLFGAAISLLLLGMGVATRRTYIPYGIFMATGAVLALLLTPPFW